MMGIFMSMSKKSIESLQKENKIIFDEKTKKYYYNKLEEMIDVNVSLGDFLRKFQKYNVDYDFVVDYYQEEYDENRELAIFKKVYLNEEELQIYKGILEKDSQQQKRNIELRIKALQKQLAKLGDN
jgi:hypothetical protein